MYKVYILQSLKNGSYYTGYSEDVDRRLEMHNAGRVKATQYKRPYRLVYTKSFESDTDARQREWQIKSWKSRVAIEELVGRAPR